MRRPILFALIALSFIMASCIILTVNIAAASGEETRIGAEAFFKTGTGARAAGIGGTFIAIADDASATYWNPAGLGQLRRHEFHATITQVSWNGQGNLSGMFKGGWSDLGRNHCFYSFGYPSRPVSLGFDFIFIGINDIEIRKDKSDATVKGSFDNSNWATSLSLASKPCRVVVGTAFLGIRYSLLRQSFSEIDAAWGHAVSCGMIYVPDGRYCRMGMTIRNLYGNMKWREQPSDSNRLTPTANFALVLPFRFFSQEISWGVNMEIERNKKSDRGFHKRMGTGVELRLLNTLFLRSGLVNLYTDPGAEQPLEASFGIGLAIERFRKAWKFDYAVAFHKTGARHLLSFGLGI